MLSIHEITYFTVWLLQRSICELQTLHSWTPGFPSMIFSIFTDQLAHVRWKTWTLSIHELQLPKHELHNFPWMTCRRQMSELSNFDLQQPWVNVSAPAGDLERFRLMDPEVSIHDTVNGSLQYTSEFPSGNFMVSIGGLKHFHTWTWTCPMVPLNTFHWWTSKC